MSLYSYKVRITGGRERIGRITAKSEVEARKRVAALVSVVEWLSLTVDAPTQPVTLPVLFRSKPLSKLQKMLYLQSGRCFFCGQPLSDQEASIEHLNPKSRGGTNSEDNEVVCHASLNATFGSMDLKRKFEFVLKSDGKFQCPK